MRASISLLCTLWVLSAAAPAPQDQGPGAERKPPIAIVKLNNDVNPDGTFTFEYETANGIRADARGAPGQGPPGEEGQRVQGGYSYLGDDGVTYSVTYTADENGFQAQGAHLPVPPEIPEEIKKALAYIAAHPEENELR